ncbi:MAG: universal stress protein, partial [Proteobacteria bacterium]|nr:universal stress protein [Pseudomonadota bacterium]
MIKNILVPHDGSAHAASAAGYALWLAKQFGATVTGLHVVDAVALEGSFLHDISGSMGFEPFMDFSSKMRAILEDNGKTVLGNFSSRCKDAGIKCHESLSSGIVSTSICEHAKRADLVVMGRRGANAGFEYGLMGSVAEATVRKSSKPVMVVPAEFKEPASALISYDGSANASKALHSAAEFAKAFSMPLTVLSASKGLAGNEKLKDAEDYLKPYAIEANLVHVNGEAPSDIVDYLKDNE